ncbi:MAG TPA: Maf family protein, partial [Chloroflexota bacterium]
MPSGTKAGSRLTRLVLASASPRRQALLGLLGLPWRVAPVEIDEDAHLGGEPAVAALNVAMAKARAMRAAADDEVLLAADTLVVIDRDVLAKPADADQAWVMLRRLRERAHQVLSGIALWRPDGMQWGGVVATRVVMRAYTDADIEAYIARGEPFDKAGGYA